jgi:hypothetical protein
MFDRLCVFASRIRGLFTACLFANCAKRAAVILRAHGFGPKDLSSGLNL